MIFFLNNCFNKIKLTVSMRAVGATCSTDVFLVNNLNFYVQNKPMETGHGGRSTAAPRNCQFSQPIASIHVP